MVAVLNLFGVMLLVLGLIAAYFAAARDRPGVPAPGWYPDPTGTRYWDGRAWTRHVRASTVVGAANRGTRFRGRFWGRWVWWLVAAIAILVAGSLAYLAYGSGAGVHLMAGTSMLAMTGICVAFYRFAARQLALDDVIGARELVSVAVATAGAVIVFAANANDAIIEAAGIRAATITVGFIEEGTKLLVPLGLYIAGRYRDPRAGIAIGLASGFAFAIIETTQYAYSTATASGPDFCGDVMPTPTAAGVVQEQVYRMFLVSPLHWLWTGTATAIAWRLWHLYGRRGTLGAVGGIL
ncbi:MAG TPA: PrsW family glutamic-type intramembrane protease, partial [Candidatus Limnocylindrales bacterium]